MSELFLTIFKQIFVEHILVDHFSFQILVILIFYQTFLPNILVEQLFSTFLIEHFCWPLLLTIFVGHFCWLFFVYSEEQLYRHFLFNIFVDQI